MTDSDFDQLLDRLADDPPAPDMWQDIDVSSLSEEQGRRLGLFLRAQAGVAQHLEAPGAFASRVRILLEPVRGGPFVQRVMKARAASPLRQSRPQWLPWLVAAAACVIAMFSWWQPRQTEVAVQVAQEKSLASVSGGPLGVLVDEVRAQFTGSHPERAGFEPGRYVMSEGLAHVRLINGTDLVLKAPVAFVIESPMRVTLERGGLRSRVPPQARGFVVAAGGVEYRDLGTEFVVSTEGASDQSSLHVYDGVVEVLKPGSSQVIESVLVGHAVSIKGEALERGVATIPALVPEAESVRLEQWKETSAVRRRDPTLIACYDFQRDSGDPDRLPDVKTTGAAHDGMIHGARWVNGRWPGKDALFFDRDDDFVQMEVPGDHNEFTVAAWVLLDRFDFGTNALFASNAWGPGGFHFNISRYARPFGGIHDETVNPAATGTVQTGIWSLLVMSADVPQGRVRCWINGKLVYDKTSLHPSGIRPGICRIGNYLPLPGEGNPVRAIRGRIDEMLVWSRAITEREIVELFEAGTPALLPHRAAAPAPSTPAMKR